MTCTVQAERGPVKFASENLHPENLIAYLTIGSLAQGELKPGFRSNSAMCSQTSPKVAFVQ